jgi:trehalose utilization protein
MPLTVTVWNEYRTERESELPAEVYPDGIHAVLAESLREEGHEVETAVLDDPEHGLTEERLDRTDVLLWWAHLANDEVADEIVDRVYDAVIDGMGFLPLHSARRSKVFKRLMGTSCAAEARDADETERVWFVSPGHPIVDGFDDRYIEFEDSQITVEPFDIPEPDQLVMISWLEGGEVFRSGCCFRRGNGRIFFFAPGHETYPVYYRDDVQQIISNAVEWAAPTDGPPLPTEFGFVDAIEPIDD